MSCRSANSVRRVSCSHTQWLYCFTRHDNVVQLLTSYVPPLVHPASGTVHARVVKPDGHGSTHTCGECRPSAGRTSVRVGTVVWHDGSPGGDSHSSNFQSAQIPPVSRPTAEVDDAGHASHVDAASRAVHVAPPPRSSVALEGFGQGERKKTRKLVIFSDFIPA